MKHLVRITCPEHAPKPNISFLGVPPRAFLGEFVKLSFPVPPGPGQPAREHMWVKVVSLSGESDYELRGELNNEPRFATNRALGDTVLFNRSEIEDVFVV